MPGWQEETGLLDLINGARPRPAPVIFNGATRALTPGYVSPAEPPLAGTDMPAVLQTPDAARVAEVNAGASGGPSFDRLREILGQDIGGSRVSAPQVFNGSSETNPLARPDDFNPGRSTAWQLYDAGRSFGNPAEIAARRNAIIGRHNLNQDLQNEYFNMGRGMYSIPRAEQVSRTGANPELNLGTEGRRAGATETAADASRIQAMTDAAKAEYGMTAAAERQRFMERFPHLTPAQLNELVAGEEARGGFRLRGLNFSLGGTPAATQGAGAQSPVTAPGAPAAVVSSFLKPEVTAQAAAATVPPVYADIQRQLEGIPGLARPTAGAGGAIPADVSPRRLVMLAQNARPDIFANPEQLRALTAYLNSRYTPTVLHGGGGAGRALMEDMAPTNPLRIFRNAAQQEAEAPARQLLQTLLEAQR